MSTEIKLTAGIIILSIAVTFIGVKLAYRDPAAGSNLNLGNTTLLSNSSNPRIVGSSSKIEIVEFADLECPSCAAMNPIIKQLLAAEGDKITFIYRNFPIHQDADKMGAYALAAGKQGKFFEMHDLMFDRQDEWADQSFDKMLVYFDSYAKSLGLDVNKIHTDMVSPEITGIVEKDTQDGYALGINSTPTIIINGKTVIKRVTQYDDFKKAVDAEIASVK
jgi:protein-disulfide isomerase